MRDYATDLIFEARQTVGAVEGDVLAWEYETMRYGEDPCGRDDGACAMIVASAGGFKCESDNIVMVAACGFKPVDDARSRGNGASGDVGDVLGSG